MNGNCSRGTICPLLLVSQIFGLGPVAVVEESSLAESFKNRLQNIAGVAATSFWLATIVAAGICIWQVQFFCIVLAVWDRLGSVNLQLLRSVRPPVDSEVDLEAVLTRAGLAGAPVALEPQLRRLQRARLALHRSALLCGQHFGAPLLLNVVCNFLVIVNLSYSVTVKLREDQPDMAMRCVGLLKPSLWMFYSLARMLIICWACSSASERAERSELLMSKVQVLLRSGKPLEVLQVSMDKLKFHAFGFFDVNTSFFLSFLGAASAYFVIVIELPK
ncbi:putative gustatory receptor 2a [Schistocerca americana]|uniref:putative gustatory receptor 2a n=1 Tax=Schistocerca americana TaxID=7009 RepID=UPI001F4FC0E5|nr:putative gustatory receptor 2a [Schistocerca americana]